MNIKRNCNGLCMFAEYRGSGLDDMIMYGDYGMECLVL